MDRLDDLEKRIRDNYSLVFQNEIQADLSDRPEEKARCQWMSEKYRVVLRGLLKTYIRICERVRQPPPEDIEQLAAEHIDYGGWQISQAGQTDHPKIPFTTLSGARVVRVEVSQMFRLVDLLTRPDSVKAQQFYLSIIGQGATIHRILGHGAGFELGDLGLLVPVIYPSEQYDAFWRPALPVRRFAADRTLGFFPFQLSLTNRLEQLNLIPGSVLESAAEGSLASIANTQISGRLRIYPPGTGVIQLGLTIEFREQIHIETIAMIAHNIEDLLFVDPTGLRKPCSNLFLEILDEVVQNLFKDEGYTSEDRRWLPPETTFSIRDDEGFHPSEHVDELAYLMQLAPGNHEPVQFLRARVAKTLVSGHWQQDQVLFAAGQGVALFFVGATFAEGKKQRRHRILEWLRETRELVSAALYAQEAFMEELEPLYLGRLLDASFLPQKGQPFGELFGLLTTLRMVLQSITSIRFHLERHGCGALVDFAKELWRFNCPNRRTSISDIMSYIGKWLDLVQGQDDDVRLSQLRLLVEDINKITPPYDFRWDGSLMPLDTSVQEALEDRLLAELARAELTLSKGRVADPTGLERALRRVTSIQQQLGIYP